MKNSNGYPDCLAWRRRKNRIALILFVLSKIACTSQAPVKLNSPATEAPSSETAAVCKEYPEDFQSGYVTNTADMSDEEYEAFTVALALTGEFLSPVTITVMVKDDLQRIRADYGSTVSSVVNSPLPQSTASRSLYVMVDQKYADAVSEATFEPWECLNEALDLTVVSDNHHFRSTNKTGFVLGFSMAYNRNLLPKLYDGPGSIVTNHESFFLFSGPNGNVGLLPQGRAYLFPLWAQCDLSCKYVSLDFFVVSDEEVIYKGKWVSGQPRPSWWAEAEQVQVGTHLPPLKDVCICGISALRRGYLE